MPNPVLEAKLLRLERERLVRGAAMTPEKWAVDIVGEQDWNLCQDDLESILKIFAVGSEDGQSEAAIWKNPKIQEMLGQPFGTPVDLGILTKEELDALVEAAFGSRPDLPPGEEYVRRIREGWGRRLREFYGG